MFLAFVRKSCLIFVIIIAVFGLFQQIPIRAHAMQQSDPLPSQLAKLHPDWIYLHGDRRIKKVALTFDDGPDLNATPNLLQILKREHVHATFFVTGQHALRYPAMVKRIQSEGHEIGNHSYDHANFKKLPIAQTLNEVESTDTILYKLLGHKPNLFRAPYGNISEAQLLQIVQHDGYKVIGWDVDSIDWKAKDPKRVTETVLAQVHPGSIILEHTIGPKDPNKNATVQSLTSIIQSLRSRGYSFVTVSQLLELHPNSDSQCSQGSPIGS
jgi:peptidoglycan-N-acetylglucosamine deacetylase